MINATTNETTINKIDDSESQIDFQWITEGLLLLLTGCIGLVGNTCSLVTCARQRIQRVFHRLLVALATFDSVSTNFVIIKKTIGYVISKDIVSLDFENSLNSCKFLLFSSKSLKHYLREHFHRCH